MWGAFPVFVFDAVCGATNAITHRGANVVPMRQRSGVAHGWHRSSRRARVGCVIASRLLLLLLLVAPHAIAATERIEPKHARDTETVECDLVVSLLHTAETRVELAKEKAHGAKLQELAGLVEAMDELIADLARLKVTSPALKKFLAEYQAFAREVAGEARQVIKRYPNVQALMAQVKAETKSVPATVDTFIAACDRSTKDKPRCAKLLKSLVTLQNAKDMTGWPAVVATVSAINFEEPATSAAAVAIVKQLKAQLNLVAKMKAATGDVTASAEKTKKAGPKAVAALWAACPK